MYGYGYMLYDMSLGPDFFDTSRPVIEARGRGSQLEQKN